MNKKRLLATFLGVGAIVVTPLVWYFDLQAKQISVQTVSRVSLASTGIAAFETVQILSGGAALAKPQLAVIEIKNSGYKEIRSSDFEGPMTFSLQTPGRIVEAKGNGSNRTNLPIHPSVREGKVELAPLLLNAGDTLTLAFLVDGDKPTFDVLARIAGVSSLNIDAADPDLRGDMEKLARKAVLAMVSLVLFTYCWLFIGLRNSTFLPNSPLTFSPKGRIGAAVVIGAAAVAPLLDSPKFEWLQTFLILSLASVAAVLFLWRKFAFGSTQGSSDS
jgi:hypothetical protein